MLTAPPDLGLDGQPFLVFQPAVDLATGRLLGFEALLRWGRAAGESLSPEGLILWAEAHGCVSELNAWIVLEACRQASGWPLQLQVAVNCSHFRLGPAGCATAVARAIDDSGLLPDRLTIEVTEATIADEDAAADLETIARLGAQLSLDDLGRDLAVLDRLSLLPINTVKMDGSLVAGLGSFVEASGPIMESIITASGSRRLCTVAEAVETDEQASALRELGVDVAQGNLFSAPIDADDALALTLGTAPIRFRLPSDYRSPALPRESPMMDNIRVGRSMRRAGHGIWRTGKHSRSRR